MSEVNELEKENLDKGAEDDVIDEVDELDDETTDWKAIALKNAGIAKRFKTKLDKANKPQDKPEVEKSVKAEKKGFDLAEKAFLRAVGVPSEDFDYIEQTMKDTGKDIESLLDAKWFQSELKERKEGRDTKNAVPQTTKRSTGAARDEVDYWLAKGELPPADQTELRRKVVNARIAKEKNIDVFSSNPIA